MEVILEAKIQHENIAHMWSGIEMIQYEITMVL